MADILKEIVEDKRACIEERLKNKPTAVVRSEIKERERDSFLDLFENSKDMILIAEVKKASPSKGIIREDFDPEAIAKGYAQAGADAVSVLTEEKYFLGKDEYLSMVQSIVSPAPVLRKDFIFSEYQIYEAAAINADTFLLIKSVLSDEELKRFIELGKSLKMTPLVEVHDEKELDSALSCGARIVGVNNRDLKTFKVDINTTVRLSDKLKESGRQDEVFLIGESGIKNREDVLLLQKHGVKGVLVGESIMREGNVRDKIHELKGI